MSNLAYRVIPVPASAVRKTGIVEPECRPVTEFGVDRWGAPAFARPSDIPLAGESWVRHWTPSGRFSAAAAPGGNGEQVDEFHKSSVATDRVRIPAAAL